MSVASVGASAELSVVGPPCVRVFNDPAESEREPLRVARRWVRPAPLDVEIIEAILDQPGAGLGIVALRV